MSSPEVFTAVRSLLDAEFSYCAVVYPNEESPTDSSLCWVYVDVAGTLVRRIELGVGMTQETGLVWLSIFSPRGTGTLESRQISKLLSKIFINSRDSPVRFGEQSHAQGQQGDDDGMFWLQQMTVEYSYEEND